MAEKKEPLSTFDPEEAIKIIEDFKKPEIKHVQGSINFEERNAYVLVEIQTQRHLFRGDESGHEPSGLFLLFSRHDLVQLLKAVFGLREKPE